MKHHADQSEFRIFIIGCHGNKQYNDWKNIKHQSTNKKKCFRVDYTTTEPFSEHLCDSPLNLFLSTCAIQLLFSQPQYYTMSSIRRHLASEQGPVPITPAMDPDFQVIVRAGNQGVHEKSSTKRKRAVKGKRFAWSEEDRFRIGKMAHELKSNKRLL